MVAAAPFAGVEEDQRVVLYGMAWQDFEAMLALRGDRAGVRMYYLDGAIEIMRPTKIHESRKKTLARLLETWAVELDLPVEVYGAWTLKREIREAGAEPDECYIVGKDKDVPDLVIEVEWSRATGLVKHEIYRRLGVRELWTLQADGQLVVRVLDKGDWVMRGKSKLFAKLDLAWLVSFLELGSQTQAVRALREAMRKPRR